MASGPRIAVQEADAVERQLLVRFLAAQGFRVTGVADAAALRAVLTDQTPDLVVMGVASPQQSALSLVRAVRAQYPAIGVLLISADDAAAAAVRGLDAGADDVVLRPFGPRELLARIRSVLRRLPPCVMARRADSRPAAALRMVE